MLTLIMGTVDDGQWTSNLGFRFSVQGTIGFPFGERYTEIKLPWTG
jgi:hypothetical protein